MGRERLPAAATWGVWLVFVALRWWLRGATVMSVVAGFLMFAILVLVPLVLQLLQREDRWSALARHLQPWAGLAAAAAFLVPYGWAAALLAVPWLAVCVLLAVSALVSIAGGQRSLRPGRHLVHAAFIYIPVGGGWLLLHRTGMPLMGFDRTIILLTAVHFHYAAFVAPVIAAFVGERLDRPAVHEAAAAGIIVSPALIAAGFTFSPSLNMFGVSLFAASLCLLAALMLLDLVPRLNDGAARSLLLTAGLSIAAGMVLALLYVFGPHAPWLPAPDIPEMAVSHGIINGFGFSLGGLLGLERLRSQPRTDADDVA